MDAPTIQTVLAGAILAAILWLVRSVNDHGKTLAQIQTILTGADGTNGLNGDVRTLKGRTDEHNKEIGEARGRHDLLEQRVDSIERRTGPADRRATA